MKKEVEIVVEKERPKVGVILDIDEVLVDSQRDWLEWLNRTLGTTVTLERLLAIGHTTLVPEWQALDEEFRRASEQIRADPEFVLGHPEIPGAREGVEKLTSLVGCEIKAYITTRPQSVERETALAVSKMGLPQAPVYCRPEKCRYENGTLWKAKLLAELAKEEELLIVVDDNPFLAEAVAKLNPEIKVITLVRPHNITQIAKDSLLHAPWENLPDLVEELLEER